VREQMQNRGNRGTQRSEIMGRAPIWKLLVRFSGPAIISMVVTSSYNIVDAIYVGRLGSEALAALAVAFPLMLVFMAIGAGTGMGSASLISRSLGADDHDKASRVAAITITLTILLGLLITAVALPNLEALLRLLGASESILPLAKSYMSILAATAVITLFAFIITNVVRAEGRPILASTAMIIAAVTNIILDPILIFGLGPIPAMEVAGAAIATVISRGVGGAILLVYIVSKRTSYRFRPDYFIPQLKIVVEIYRVGLASIIRMVAGSIVMVVANRITVSYGVTALAIRSILFRASSFAFMPALGLGQGLLPLVGYNFGAKNNKRVGEVVIKSCLVAFVWGVICLASVMLFSREIVAIFNTEPRFLLEAAPALRIFALAFFTIGIQMILTFFFQGIGKSLPSIVLASARQIVFLFPALLILNSLIGLNGIWAAFPVADILAFILAIIWAGIEFRRLEIPFRLRYK